MATEEVHRFLRRAIEARCRRPMRSDWSRPTASWSTARGFGRSRRSTSPTAIISRTCNRTDRPGVFISAPVDQPEAPALVVFSGAPGRRRRWRTSLASCSARSTFATSRIFTRRSVCRTADRSRCSAATARCWRAIRDVEAMMGEKLAAAVAVLHAGRRREAAPTVRRATSTESRASSRSIRCAISRSSSQSRWRKTQSLANWRRQSLFIALGTLCTVIGFALLVSGTGGALPLARALRGDFARKRSEVPRFRSDLIRLVLGDR